MSAISHKSSDMSEEIYPPESTHFSVPTCANPCASPKQPKTSAAPRLHPGVTVILPRGGRGYALRCRLPDGSVAQPGLQPGLTLEDATALAVHLSACLQAGIPVGARAQAAKPSRAAKGPERAHKGVQVIPPRPGRAYYALRYTDPVTRQRKQPQLAGVTSQAAAHAHAVELYRSLQERALKAVLAGGRERAAAAAITVREESALYVADVARKVTKHGLPTAKSTVRSYRRQLESFAVWCDERGVARLSQLERSTLVAWLDSRLAAPAHGRVREVSTVNQEVKPVRQMLVAAAQAERIHLSTDVIRGALKRRTQRASVPRCLPVDETQATLQAALDYDARGGGKPHKPIAPVVAAALLSGMRRRELSELQCHEVKFNAASQYDKTVPTGHDLIDLPGHKTKTGAPRAVLMSPYSPLLGELLRALTRGRSGTHKVFGLSYQGIGSRVKRLRKHGAPPDLRIKTLRSTCATCQLPLPGDLKAKAGRLGHTLAVAEAYYLAAPTGLPLSAPNLETVMKCEALVREIIERVTRGGARS